MHFSRRIDCAGAWAMPLTISVLNHRMGLVAVSNGDLDTAGLGASLPPAVESVAVSSRHFSTVKGTSTIEQSSVNRGPRWSYATTRSTCGPAATSTISHHSWLFSRNGAFRR